MIPKKLISQALPLYPSRRLSTIISMVRTSIFRSSITSVVAVALPAVFLTTQQAYADEGLIARNAILTHPNVARLRDTVCSYYAQVDIARSGKYPQVNFRVYGSSSLSSHIETREANSRRLDDREIDAVIGLSQNIYDWGITNRSVQIAETQRRIAHIEVQIETARQAADLLSLLLRHQELSDLDGYYSDLRRELSGIADRIKDGVDAGALTLTDLRDIKINNLDIEINHIQVKREIDLVKSEVSERFKVTVEAAMPFLIYYLGLQPAELPHFDSANANEVRKLDLQRMITDFELEQLKAQRKPSVSAQVDTTLFDADSFSGEYEVTGRLQLSMPLYDGAAAAPLKGQMIYVMIGVFFVVAVIWASLAQIDEVVRAEGAIVPSDNVQLVQTRLPGSIVYIQASLGDKVRQGDVMFRIEDEDVVANFDDNEINRLSAQAAIVRLEAERNNLDEVVFPSELTAAAPEIVAQEKALFHSRKNAKEGEVAVLIQEGKSLDRAINEREAEARLAMRQIATIEKEREIIAPLVKKGYEPKIALLSIDARLQESMGRKELADLGAVRLRSDREGLQKRLSSLENRFKTDTETTLVEMRTLAAQAEARLDALKGKVAYADVRAPVDGIISAVHIKTMGGVVEGGAVLAEVIPFEEEVTVRAKVMTDDIAKIVPGQQVRISLSSYDVSRYGALEGTIETIASNSTEEQNQPPYFVAMVKIPDPTFPNSGFKPEITPGMTAIVDVLGDKRTILGYILSPIKRAQTIAFKEK